MPRHCRVARIPKHLEFELAALACSRGPARAAHTATAARGVLEVSPHRSPRLLVNAQSSPPCIRTAQMGQRVQRAYPRRATAAPLPASSAAAILDKVAPSHLRRQHGAQLEVPGGDEPLARTRPLQACRVGCIRRGIGSPWPRGPPPFVCRVARRFVGDRATPCGRPARRTALRSAALAACLSTVVLQGDRYESSASPSWPEQPEQR